jgi:anti-sigma factor (TIGR02949 family)
MQKTDPCTCQEAFHRLNDYLDRELTQEEIRMVQAHLEICATCAMEFQFEANVLKQIRAKVRQIQAPPALLSKVLKVLKQVEDKNDGI